MSEELKPDGPASPGSPESPESAPEAARREQIEITLRLPKLSLRRPRRGPDAELTEPVDPEEREESAPAGPPAPREPLPGWMIAVALALVVLFTAGTVLTGLLYLNDRQQATAAREATSAAESAAAGLFSYSSASIDDDVVEAKRRLTGVALTDYEKLLNDVILPATKQVNITVKAEIRASAVVRATESRVVVLLFATQTSQVPQQPANVIGSRIEATMVKKDGDWLLAEIARV